MRIAEVSYEGFWGVAPLLGVVRGGGMSLVRKIHRYLLKHLPSLEVLLRSDSAGYNHRLMGYCDQNHIGFVIAGRELEAIFQIIQGIRHWERLCGGREKEEVGEGLHFVGPEKQGAAYRLIVVRKRNSETEGG